MRVGRCDWLLFWFRNHLSVSFFGRNLFANKSSWRCSVTWVPLLNDFHRNERVGMWLRVGQHKSDLLYVFLVDYICIGPSASGWERDGRCVFVDGFNWHILDWTLWAISDTQQGNISASRSVDPHTSQFTVWCATSSLASLRDLSPLVNTNSFDMGPTRRSPRHQNHALCFLSAPDRIEWDSNISHLTTQPSPIKTQQRRNLRHLESSFGFLSVKIASCILMTSYSSICSRRAQDTEVVSSFSIYIWIRRLIINV